ncbi:unnamed protein product [Umbelopsis sp. WA50703]
MLTYFTQDYVQNLQLYIKTHLESMCNGWVEHCLKLRGLPQTAARNMAKLAWEYATEDENDEQGDDALDMLLEDDEAMAQHQEHPAADPAVSIYVERIRAHKTTMDAKL